VGARRPAWRTLCSIEQKEEAKGGKNLALIRDQKKKIEDELTSFCSDILNLVQRNLIPSAKSAESKVFFLKMQGDYYRYMAEYSSGEAYSEARDGAFSAYKLASEVANADLRITNPIRLGLALNFSVFYYEVMSDPQKACQLAKEAFDNAIADIDQPAEEDFKDATTIMALIKDNLSLWTSDEMDEALVE